MQKQNKKNRLRPRQEQKRQPGVEWKLKPQPVFWDTNYFKEKKLAGRVAIITGGDSGIGRATAVSFAMHGAGIAILYLDEIRDAKETQKFIKETTGVECLLIR